VRVLRDLDELYLMAQLAADSEAEAALLVDEALERRQKGDNTPAAQLILQLIQSAIPGRPLNKGQLLISDRVPSLIADLVGDVLLRLKPSRRIAVMQAFQPGATDASERSVFLLMVRRAFEKRHPDFSKDAVTDPLVSRALQDFLSASLSPVPATRRDEWESRFLGGDNDGGNKASASQSNRKKSKNRFPLVARIAIGVLLILVASAIGTWITSPPTPADKGLNGEWFDVLTQYDVDNEPAFRSEDPAQIERYIFDRLSRTMQVPSLESGLLVGVSLATPASDLQLPVLHYQDGTSSDEIQVFMLDYRFLTDVEATFIVDSGILQQITSESGSDVRSSEDLTRAIWRHRDDIYVAISPPDMENLRNRFSFE